MQSKEPALEVTAHAVRLLMLSAFWVGVICLVNSDNERDLNLLNSDAMISSS